MKYSEFINKTNNLNFIAHRLGFKMTKFPENSLNVLKEIFKRKEILDSLYGFEFDICFTKDNVPIVIHDKYIDDISNSRGLVKRYSFNELKKMDFSFRKSSKTNNAFTYKIATLTDILDFFNDNNNLLGKKIIKIESKDIILFSKKKLNTLADIINKYPKLKNNIIHLSFYPINLILLKKFQKKNNFYLSKCDLLCDYKAMVIISRLMKDIDYISLRIKKNHSLKINSSNSLRVNRKLLSNFFFMKFSNAIDDKTVKYILNRCGCVNFYTLNNKKDINSFCTKISSSLFNEFYNKFIFTSDNVLDIKKVNY